MKKRILFTAFLILFMFLSVNMVFAQRGTVRSDIIDIRLASALPRNSEWGRALDRLAADWQRITNNQVRVVVSHDGREGSELTMLSLLSSNSIQAAVLTSTGIAEICPEVMNISVPFLIRNEAELDIVLDHVLPVLESNYVHNDYIVLAWSKGGWVYLFSKDPIFTPEDLRRQSIATSVELEAMNNVFRIMGFNLTPTDWTTLGPRLASNAVNTIYVTPSVIAPMQLHRHLGHMLDMPIAPAMGAIVMNRVTWNRISPAHQQEILRATHRMALDFDSSVTRTEINAISAMDRDGLRINRLTPAQQQLWSNLIQTAMPQLVGSTFNRELYDQINDILERARNRR